MTRHFVSLLLASMVVSLPFHPSAQSVTFGDDVAFLEKHADLIVLADEAGMAKVALSAKWQGRVLTSTAQGDEGPSFGWINRALIASGRTEPHINVFGGEDRFWLGPEGGQFSIFFARGARFDLADWYTPAPIDTEPFDVAAVARDRARFTSAFTLTNYSGTRFEVSVDREVRMLDAAAAWARMGAAPASGVRLVAFESDNRITNAGTVAWAKPTGLLSIWILGMFTPSPTTTIVVPIVPGAEGEMGPRVTSDYFGAVPPERLVVRERAIYFSGDGRYRSKIGVSPRRSTGVLGSYDPGRRVLTIVQFTQPAGATDYVNSLWKIQDDPYGGDAANSYNDGPPEPGARPLGPFYELESSSPAAALAPGATAAHVHRTVHLTGPEAALDPVARAVLGVSVADITSALGKR